MKRDFSDKGKYQFDDDVFSVESATASEQESCDDYYLEGEKWKKPEDKASEVSSSNYFSHVGSRNKNKI